MKDIDFSQNQIVGELKRYKPIYQPVSWVFFGKNRNCPLDITAELTRPAIVGAHGGSLNSYFIGS